MVDKIADAVTQKREKKMTNGKKPIYKLDSRYMTQNQQFLDKGNELKLDA